MESTEPQTLRPWRPSSFGADAFARFNLNVVRVVGGAVMAVITARALGPSGKGDLSALLFVSLIAGQASTLGLGEAATALAGGDRSALRGFLGSSLPAVVVTSFLGATVVWLLSTGAGGPSLEIASVLAAVSVPFIAIAHLLLTIEIARDRIRFASGVEALRVVVEVAIVAVLVGVARWGIPGGAAAVLAASSASSAVLALSLRRSSFVDRPRWDAALLRQALGLGGGVQIAYVLMLSTQRADLLLVHSLRGSVETGIYSVALTVAQVATYAAASIAAAAFPRLAAVESGAFIRSVARVARAGAAVGIMSAVLLGCVAPILIPVIFGSAFSAAVQPALLLLVGSVFWGVQWSLTRAAIASGSARTAIGSFGASLVVMIGGGVLVVPRFGAVGAAIAATAANGIGLLVAARWYLHVGGNARALIPHRTDFVRLRDAFPRRSPPSSST